MAKLSYILLISIAIFNFLKIGKIILYFTNINRKKIGAIR
jgi:hypothetical protein